MTRIALDIESTLADIRTVFEDEYYNRNGQCPGKTTDWDFEDVDFELREFLEITGSNWKHRASDIPPTEKGLMAKVNALRKQCDTLDIVTGRRGHEDVMGSWLDSHGVVYDHFVVSGTQQSKSEMGYDVLIDDCPIHAEELESDQVLFLYDQPYNQHIEEADNIYRVESLTEVVKEIQNL